MEQIHGPRNVKICIFLLRECMFHFNSAFKTSLASTKQGYVATITLTSISAYLQAYLKYI